MPLLNAISQTKARCTVKSVRFVSACQHVSTPVGIASSGRRHSRPATTTGIVISVADSPSTNSVAQCGTIRPACCTHPCRHCFMRGAGTAALEARQQSVSPLLCRQPSTTGPLGVRLSAVGSDIPWAANDANRTGECDEQTRGREETTCSRFL